LELFRDFLRSEFSDENLEFWIACEEYKQYKSNKLEAEAQRIFGDFVAVQAPREVTGQKMLYIACLEQSGGLHLGQRGKAVDLYTTLCKI